MPTKICWYIFETTVISSYKLLFGFFIDDEEVESYSGTTFISVPHFQIIAYKTKQILFIKYDVNRQ